MAQAQAFVRKAPLTLQLARRRIKANQRRIHALHVQLGAAAFSLRGNATVGHQQAAVAVQQQLVWVHAVAGPFAGFFQAGGIAHANQALAGLQVGFGGVERAAISAGNDMAIKGAVRLGPDPKRRATARLPAHQPVARPARDGQQAAAGLGPHAMGAGRHIERRADLQRSAAWRQHTDLMVAVGRLPASAQALRGNGASPRDGRA